MHPFVALMRRYVVDYLLGQNPSVCAQIMEPDYVLHMGGTDLGPRDEVYVPAVVRQLEQFPGLGMTVHEIMLNGDRLAMRFSQHGASTRHHGRQASWGGIGLYRWNGVRLTSNFAIEDYYSRRIQLAEGRAHPVEPPAVAPWDTAVEESSMRAEECVRLWLTGAMLAAQNDVWVDDEPVGNASPLIEVTSTMIDELFSAGDRVAFHVTQTGTYTGGLDVPPSAVGRMVTLFSVGVLRPDVSGRMSGRMIRERAALQRALAEP
jgi:hypothetical protein